MADDIDDLLDEVESKFVKKKTADTLPHKERVARYISTMLIVETRLGIHKLLPVCVM